MPTDAAKPLKIEVPNECLWYNRTGKPRYWLSAVMFARIYPSDKSKLTSRELKQWLVYMRYIGVEHVYFYDTFVTPDEAQKDNLTMFLDESYVTYIDWHEHNPYTRERTQLSAYKHCAENYANESQWQVSIDIDEYPFSTSDTKVRFLSRFVEEISSKHPAVAEISMQNFLFLGKPQDEELFFGRYWRRTPQRSNVLVKPIFQPSKVKPKRGAHHNSLKSGRPMYAPENEMRLNHYWGARLQNWGDDTPEILGKTMEDRSMKAVVDEFRRCGEFLRPYIT